MSKWSTRQLATAAIIAALYTVMSLLSSVFGLTYGPIQCRFSEALTVLPFFLPEAVPGLFVGCLVTNLMSTVGPLDIIFGSMATLLAVDGEDAQQIFGNPAAGNLQRRHHRRNDRVV